MKKFKDRIVRTAAQENALGKQILKLLPKRKLSYETLQFLSLTPKPEYGYCLLQACKLAVSLGRNAISVIEFGVAGGRGLLALEYHAENISRITGVSIKIFGFDSGQGLPSPSDYRDLPYYWSKGEFNIDVEKLERRLKNSQLVIGDVSSTTKDFFLNYFPPPIGAVFFDLDFYSSTCHALDIMENHENFLPRVYCYFDDVIGGEDELYGDFTGERLAINEFNSREVKKVKLDIPYHLRISNRKSWYHKIWIAHFYEHPQYNQYISQPKELPI